MMKEKESYAVPVTERTTTAKDLFFIWFANNIGILGIVMGMMIVAYGLNFYQSVLVAALGSLSFAVVGVFSVIGKRYGLTTFMMSRVAFGTVGNVIPSAIAWVNLVGWLAINIITGTLILQSVLAEVFQLSGTAGALVALGVLVGLILLASTVGAQTLAKIQTWMTYVFGALSLVVLFYLVKDADWGELLAVPAGSWTVGFIPALAIIAGGTGINWTGSGADYGAYQRPDTSEAGVFLSTTFGSFIPLFTILVAGVIVGLSDPALLLSENPTTSIQHSLPPTLATVYLLTAVGGFIPPSIVGVISANMSLEAMNIRVSQKTSLIFHGGLMVALPLYVLFYSASFLGSFETFLGLLGVFLSSWAAVFLADYTLYRRDVGYAPELMDPSGENRVNGVAIASWVLGVIAGLLFTDNGLIRGPFTQGIFADGGLSVFLAAAVAGLVMILFQKRKDRQHVK